MKDTDEQVEFEDSKVKAETDKAIKAWVDGRWLWVPKSQIADESEVYKAGTDGTLIVSRWWAEKEGLV